MDKPESIARKAYASPRVLYTEKIEARAVSCAAATDAQCGAGPIDS
jgi:hypothetical protein